MHDHSRKFKPQTEDELSWRSDLPGGSRPPARDEPFERSYVVGHEQTRASARDTSDLGNFLLFRRLHYYTKVPTCRNVIIKHWLHADAQESRAMFNK
eukprot:scaffold165536_cov39-Tisochrysis_lutea.AAC.1